MAIAAGCIWEVRTTGNANNGGGFVSGGGGTDYSQQDAAQYNYTDLASANATSNPPTVTSASHSFVAADVGNIMHITAGTNWTAGWYEIVSVSGGGAVLDKACGTAASISGGTYYVGGAYAFGAATDDAFLENAVAGHIFYVKSGTYSLGVNVSIAAAGSALKYCSLLGYNTTRGDEPTGNNRPFLDYSTNTFAITGNLWKVENLRFRGGTGSTCLAISGAYCLVRNCKMMQISTTTARTAFSLTNNMSTAIICEAFCNRGVATTITSNAKAIGCWIHSSATGMTGAGTYVINCIVSHCYTYGLQLTSTVNAAFLYGNTIYGSPNKIGTAGISLGTGLQNGRLMSNIIYGWTTGVSHADAGQLAGFDDFNNYNNNTTDVTNWTKGANCTTGAPGFTGATRVAGTGATTSNTGNTLVKTGANFVTNGFTAGRDAVYLSGGSATTGMYQIVSVDSETQLTLDIAPGNSTANVDYEAIVGANFAIDSTLKGTGYPGTINGGYSVGYADPGAVQRQEVTYTDPGIANVKTGVGYTFAGAALVGTYEGSDRWTDPGEANVKSGTAYKANSTTNNKTGTYDGSDLNSDPGVANVLEGVAYKAGSSTNNRTGTYKVVVPAVVLKDITFGASGAETGTYSVPAPPFIIQI